jgi:hypothetical protein
MPREPLTVSMLIGLLQKCPQEYIVRLVSGQVDDALRFVVVAKEHASVELRP